MGTASCLYIEDEDNDVLWRAYPGDNTTIEELLRACVAFDLRPFVDTDLRVCLIMSGEAKLDKRVGAAGGHIGPPGAALLAEAMYGLGDMALWPSDEVRKWTPPALPILKLDEPAIEFEGGEKPFDRFVPAFLKKQAD